MKKRGILLVIGLLLLLVLRSALSEEISWSTFHTFYIGGDIDDCSDGIDERDGFPRLIPPGSEYNPSVGCWLYSREIDDDTGDQGKAALRPGFVFPNRYSPAVRLYPTSEKTLLEDDAEEWDNPFECSVSWRSRDDSAYLCSDDHQWYSCSNTIQNQVLPVQTNTGASLFVCLKLGSGYTWFDVNNLEGVDRDSDLVPDVLDCAPDNGRIHGEFACHREEAAERTCITDEECADLVEGTCKPNGKCEQKVCVQTSATEICGDGIDNDCSEWDGTENYDYTQADDDCDLDQAACESNCLSVGKPCSWIDLDDGGICCGDDGVTDLGTIIQDGTADEMEDDFVCLNQNAELVGSSAAGNNQK